MSDVRNCPRCEHQIDRGARMCPYCNFDLVLGKVPERSQEPVVDPAPVVPEPAASPRWSPPRLLWSPRVLVAAAVAILLLTTFAVGALVRGLSGNDEVMRPREHERAATRQPGQPTATDLRFVPVDDPTQTIGRSITSAPIPDPDHQTPSEFQRRDATALPADQYSRILEQSKTQTAPPPLVVDPRTMVSQAQPTVPDELRQREERARAREAARRAEPEQASHEGAERGEWVDASPISQPLPNVRGLRRDVTLRFRLLIGSNGRVKEVSVVQGHEGLTGQMIRSIQKWKFKPATRNGQPVEAVFPVDIFFNAE